MVGTYEYKMPELMAKTILSDAKRYKAKGSKQKILCDYVNEQLGIKGLCVKVIIE